MPFDCETTPMRATALLSTAAALAIWDVATNDSQRIAAGEAMAAAIRRTAPKKRAAAAPAVAGDQLTGAALLAALARLGGVIEARNQIPALDCVEMRSAGGVLALRGSDLDMEWVETLKAEGAPAFHMLIPLRDLVGAVRGHKGRVGFGADGLGLTVEAGGVETRIAGLPPADLPIMAPREAYASAIIPAERLVGPMRFTQMTISTEETRYYLNGLNGLYMHVAQHQGAERLTFVASDGHRLSIERADDTCGLPADMPAVILPRKLVGWLVKHLTGEVMVEVAATGVRFTTDTGTMIAKVIDGPFPDYMRVIPRDREGTLVHIEDAKAVSATIARLAATSRDKHRSVRLEIGALGVLASVRNLDGGKAEATLPETHTAGAAAVVGFNVLYLREFLTWGEPVELWVGGKDAPARVEWPDHPNRIGVLMPLRT
jgi:DNA polymerase-3 subunit beta